MIRASPGISPNLLQESLSESSATADGNTGEETLCESPLLNEKGLISVLLEAVDHFSKGTLYEIAVAVRTLHEMTCCCL